MKPINILGDHPHLDECFERQNRTVGVVGLCASTSALYLSASEYNDPLCSVNCRGNV
jgi:hypothetical protein